MRGIGATVGIDNAGVPAIRGTSNSGAVDMVQSLGVGLVEVDYLATRGFAPLGSANAGTLRGVLAASGLRAFGCDPSAAVTRGLSCLQEGAAGAASALTDFDLDLIQISENQWENAKIIGLGAITGGVAPAWDWASGAFDQATGITRAGPGDLTIATLAVQGIDASELIALVGPRGDPGNLMRAAAINPVTDTTFQLTSLEEGAAGVASALTDMDLAVALLAPGHYQGPTVGQLHAAALIQGDAVAPSFDFATGVWDQATGITRNGAGDYTVPYLATQGIDEGESLHFFLPAGVLAASGLRTIGYTRPTDGQVRMFMSQEGAAGAASAYTDYNAYALSMRLRGSNTGTGS